MKKKAGESQAGRTAIPDIASVCDLCKNPVLKCEESEATWMEALSFLPEIDSRRERAEAATLTQSIQWIFTISATCLNSGSPVTNSAFLVFANAAAKQSA